MKEYTLEEIEAMVDDLPNGPLKKVAKRAMTLVTKAGIPKTTKIIDSDELHCPPTGRDTPKKEQAFHLSDEEVAELLAKQEEGHE
jgi:hypothetical protein